MAQLEAVLEEAARGAPVAGQAAANQCGSSQLEPKWLRSSIGATWGLLEPSLAVLEACGAILAAQWPSWAVLEPLVSPREMTWPPRDLQK